MIIRRRFVAGKRLAQTAIPLRFSLLTAIGTELWQRRIADAVTADGRIATGLTEQYRIVYGRLGMKTGKQIQLREGAITLGLKYPLVATEQVSGFDSTLTLRPGRQAALYARLVLTGKRSTVGWPGALVLYYESYRLRRSAGKASSIAEVPVTVFQPQSHMDILGMSFWLFF